MSKNRHTSRRPAQPSALLLRLIARVTGWLKEFLARWNPLRKARKVVADFRRIHFETLEPRLLMSADLFPAASSMAYAYGPQQPVAAERSMLADPQSQSSGHAVALSVSASATQTATVTDADGTVITVTVSGAGALELLAQGNGYALNMSGTTVDSVVTLTASGGNGKAQLTGIKIGRAHV